MIMWENAKSTDHFYCVIFSWLSVDFDVHETFRNMVLENIAAALWKRKKQIYERYGSDAENLVQM